MADLWYQAKLSNGCLTITRKPYTFIQSVLGRWIPDWDVHSIFIGSKKGATRTKRVKESLFSVMVGGRLEKVCIEIEGLDELTLLTSPSVETTNLETPGYIRTLIHTAVSFSASNNPTPKFWNLRKE